MSWWKLRRHNSVRACDKYKSLESFCILWIADQKKSSLMKVIRFLTISSQTFRKCYFVLFSVMDGIVVASRLAASLSKKSSSNAAVFKLGGLRVFASYLNVGVCVYLCHTFIFDKPLRFEHNVFHGDCPWHCPSTAILHSPTLFWRRSNCGSRIPPSPRPF